MAMNELFILDKERLKAQFEIFTEKMHKYFKRLDQSAIDDNAFIGFYNSHQ